MPSWDPGSSLRTWLRKAPKPARIRVRTVDGEERLVELSADLRGRWKGAEEAVLAMSAVSVECLDEKGATLRAMRLEPDGDPDEASPATSTEKAVALAVGKERREMAGILDAYGKQLVAAFHAGAAAANVGQDHLTQLVGDLTGNLTSAITNVHNMAVNLANVLTEHADGSDDKQSMNANVLMALLAGGGRGGAPPHANGNGKGGKTP